MAGVRLSAAAESDIVNALTWSEAQFGEAASLRYERLIATALTDVATSPTRPGSMARPELGEGVRTWHLRLSRDRARAGIGVVQRPRHFVIYRTSGDVVIVGRILHDAMELERHMRDPPVWE